VSTKSYVGAECLNGLAHETTYFAQFLLSGAAVEAPLRSQSIGALGSISINSGNTTLDLSKRNREVLESIECNGYSILKQPHNLNLIPSALVVVALVVMWLCIAVNAALATWVVYYKNRRLIRNSSPAFMLQVSFRFSLSSLPHIVSCLI
jgi:hypothetical protein